LSLHQSCCNQPYLTFSFSCNYFGVIFTEFSSGVIGIATILPLEFVERAGKPCENCVSGKQEGLHRNAGLQG
jgi:hypothetical protein